MPDTLIVLDYGSQYTQLIIRRLREVNIYCELFSWRTAADKIMSLQPKGIILSGSPKSVYEAQAPTLPAYVVASGLPILGICYGLQLLAHEFGGHVAQSQRHEYGRAHLYFDQPDHPLFAHLTQTEMGWPVWMSHGDRVDRLPDTFQVMGHTDNAPYAAIANEEHRYYAVQFHPEVSHTPQGQQLLRNFAELICGCQPDWTPENFIEKQVGLIQEQVGDGRVVLGLSGGVDSAVAGALIHRAIGDQLTSIFVDHGLLRRGEAAQVIQTFREQLGMNLVAINAIEEYLSALTGVVEPEHKRRIIGHKFIDIFAREAQQLGHIQFLAQGTIYPDVIESASSKDRLEATTIKTHHNVGGLPDDLPFELVEPLRQLFKDEVRRIGTVLGLPDEIIWRQPFPGPGLAIRCLGEVTWARLEKLRHADAIFTEELRRANLLRHETQQAFAVLLPVQSVGVMGDQRTYEEVVALRAVTTEDFMTADWVRLDYDLLAHVSRRIVNEVQGISRVTYDITSKPPGTIEWE